ncbi:helix-turn-helix domain-containing protein [Bradyrhizobium elkanii]|uniref:Helix-turn-helix domain-containing protein n=1 Tax=Bradyrhizobium elkanii TaxID=29448 RepID=A0A4V6CY52_BRAEL|nr:helix-turn-helix domain-containing protein [Bradyrhizobium elkanii]
MQQFLDVKAAAKHVCLSPGTLNRLRVTGDGPVFIRPVPGRVVYDVTDLDAWLWARRRKSTSEAEAA